MPDEIRVIQYGLGPIGSGVARHAAGRAGVRLVGGVDVDPRKIGRDVGEIIGLDRKLGVFVSPSLAEAVANAEADVVLHTTQSYFDLFKGQILEIVAAGLDVVSTAEELCYPWLAHAEDAAEVDAAAKKVGRRVLATGINPGFLMDSLPLYLTGICQRVDRLDITRAQNASIRRGPFQAKIGSGLTVEEFREKMEAGRMGHVGLPESMGMLFEALGRKLARYESSVEPIVAERPVKTEHFEVPAGRVRGLKQVARGYTDEGEFVTLNFIAALDGEEDGDTIKITGEPNLEVKLTGTNGDLATAAIAVNAIKSVRKAAPGLLTMRDLPLVTW